MERSVSARPQKLREEVLDGAGRNVGELGAALRIECRFLLASVRKNHDDRLVRHRRVGHEVAEANGHVVHERREALFLRVG